MKKESITAFMMIRNEKVVTISSLDPGIEFNFLAISIKKPKESDIHPDFKILEVLITEKE